MIICFCGAAGSGKTTTAQKLSEKNNATLFSYDEFKKECKARQLPEMRLQMYQSILSSLQSKENVVIDDLNITKASRTILLKNLKSASCKKILIVMDTPLKECLRRNNQRSWPAKLPEDVIINIYNLYESPSVDEGWDKIIYVEYIDDVSAIVEKIINNL